MKFDSNVFYALLPNASQNPARPVSSAKLLQPLTNSANAPREGDVYVFDVTDESENVAAMEQDITNSQYVAVNIACTRNGKPGVIAQGALTRIDADFNPTCDFCRDMREHSNLGALLDTLKGKTVKVTAMVEKEFTTFGTDTRVKRMTPVFEFVK